MKRQLKKIVCLALITSMILGQKTLKTTKNVTAKEKKDIKIAIDAGHLRRQRQMCIRDSGRTGFKYKKSKSGRRSNGSCITCS